jgi:hypothetical protein
MPRLGFEPTALVFEQAKTAHASDRAATVIGNQPTIQSCIGLVADSVIN